jgi:hypothetical protein
LPEKRAVKTLIGVLVGGSANSAQPWLASTATGGKLWPSTANVTVPGSLERPSCAPRAVWGIAATIPPILLRERIFNLSLVAPRLMSGQRIVIERPNLGGGKKQQGYF